MLTSPPLSNTPLLVWMSMMPAVRRPYSAGNAPVIRRTVGQARIQRLAEHRNTLGQDDAVQPVLQAVVLAAHMQLAETVLRHARHLQDHGIELGVVAAGLGLNVLGVDGVGGGAGLGLDAVAAAASFSAVTVTLSVD